MQSLALHFRGLEKKAVYALGALLLVLLVSYMYFVSASVHHIVLREEVSSEIAKAHSEVGLMEAEYLAKANDLTLSQAHVLGFTAVGEKHFATKRSSGGEVLTLRE